MCGGFTCPKCTRARVGRQGKVVAFAAMKARGAYRGLLGCLLLSGMSGLIYEVAWVRSLELIFGATTFAVATVLASFMGGLAAGSAVAGALTPRFERHHPLRLYASFEVLIAVVGLLIPAAFRALVPLVQVASSFSEASFTLFSLVRFLICAGVLLVPTALMGATLPVVSRYAAFASAEAGSGETARRIGVLFAVNTAGAVVGCAAAGLLLLPALGLRGTQGLAVALNLAAAAGAWALARRVPFAGAPVPAASGAASGAAPEAASGAPAAGRAALLVGCYAVSGAVAMLYEVAWSRFLVLVIGSSTYSYTIMLTTFLVGLTAGAWLGTRLLRPGTDPMLAVALCQLLVGVGTFLGLFTAGELPWLYHVIHDAFDPSAHGLLVVQLVLAAGVMLVPTIGLGAMFPLTIGGLEPGGTRAPRLVARAYAWNTCGAIAGSIAAGFWLIPMLGSRNVLIAGILANSAVAAAGLAATGPAALGRGRRALLLALVALFAVNLFVATPAWRQELLSSGIFRYADRYRGLDRAAFRERMRASHGEFLFFDEGLTCTVTVFRTTQSLTLAVNGKPDAMVPPGLAEPVPTGKSQPIGDLPTQVLVGQLPLLLAERIDDVLVVGLGSGVTLGSVLTHPVGRVDCLELEHAVVRASRLFDTQSGAPLDDRRVRLLVNDARNDLLVRDRAYDVIISEPSNPWIPGASTLFTRDFFEVARRRLRPDGVFCQWIQMYELWPDDFGTILRSFMAVFPAVQIWRIGSDAVLLGGAADIALPVDRLSARATERVRGDLARIGIRAPEDLLARFWIGGEELSRAVAPGPVNTDDNMRIEFAAPLRMLSRDPRRLERQGRELNAMFLGRTTGVLPHLRPQAGDPAQRAAFLERLAGAALVLGHADEARVYADAALGLERRPGALIVRAAALAALGRPAEAAEARAAAEAAFPRDPDVRRTLLVAAAQEAHDPGVRRHAAALVALAPADLEARAVLAGALARDGDDTGALAVLEPVLARLAEDAGAGGPPAAAGHAPARAGEGAALLAGRLLAAAGRPAEAVALLRTHLRRHSDDREAAALLATALRRSGDEAGAAAVERPLQPDAARQAAALVERARVALAAGRADEARADLVEARRYAPDDDLTLFLLARTLAQSGDRDGAIATVTEALASRPDRPWAVGYLGSLLADAGRTAEAAALAARHRALTGVDWEPPAGLLDTAPGAP
jgi:spermidine synthase